MSDNCQTLEESDPTEFKETYQDSQTSYTKYLTEKSTKQPNMCLN